MKINVKAWITLLSLSLASQAIWANDQTVVYQSERGSKLELNFNQETLTGTFMATSVAKECENTANVKRPIIGYLNGTVITFSVNYPTCGYVVTFMGHINSDKTSIVTTTLLARQLQSETNNVESTFILHSKFTREKKAE